MSESSNTARETGAADEARKKQLLALGAVAALAVVAAVGYFVFIRGGSSSSNTPVRSATTQQHAGEKSSSPSALPSQTPAAVPAAYNAPAGHNPFKPLVVDTTAAAGGGASASSSASPSATPSVIVVPTQTPTPTPTQASPSPTVTVTATPSPTGLPTAGQSITLTLVSVDSTAGTVDVTVKQGSTTTPYNGIKPGQVFGTYFKLVSILSSDPASPPVVYGADFEYGDQFVQLGTGEWSQFG